MKIKMRIKRFKVRLRRFSKMFSYQERFRSLVKKFGLDGRVDLNVFHSDKGNIWTLVPIVKEGEDRRSELPSGFIAGVRKISKGKANKFRVSEGRTIEEIQKEIRSFQEHCALYHAFD